MNILKLYRRNNKTTDNSGEIQYDEMRCISLPDSHRSGKGCATPHYTTEFLASHTSFSQFVYRDFSDSLEKYMERNDKIITTCHSNYDIFIDEIDNSRNGFNNHT